jgi:hypothetical protein
MNFCSPLVTRAHIQIEYFFMLYRNMGTSALIQVFMLGTSILGTTKHEGKHEGKPNNTQGRQKAMK